MVPTLDVVAIEGELFLVMEYVPGESLAKLTRNQKRRPTFRIVSAVMAGALHGLHAAHEATDERGVPLGIVHRDVSPQNILVGTDGVPKLLDFGVAKAAGRTQHTREGQIKGKLSYMPPEQLRGGNVTRHADVYAAGIVLWEMLTGERLFYGENEGIVIAKILDGRVVPPSRVIMGDLMTGTLSDRSMRELDALDRVTLRALDMDPTKRYATAQEMAIDLERSIQPSTGFEVSEWVSAVAREVLATRATKVSEIESSSGGMDHDRVMSALTGKATLVVPNHSMTAALPGGLTGTTANGPSGPSVPNARPSVPNGVPSSNPNGVASGSPSYPHLNAGGSGPVPSSPRMQVDPPVTQPSTISVSSVARARVGEARQRRNAALISLPLLFLCVLAIGLALRHRREANQGAAPSIVATPIIAVAGSSSAAVDGADAGSLDSPNALNTPNTPSTPNGVASASASPIATIAAPAASVASVSPGKPNGARGNGGNGGTRPTGTRVNVQPTANPSPLLPRTPARRRSTTTTSA